MSFLENTASGSSGNYNTNRAKVKVPVLSFRY